MIMGKAWSESSLKLDLRKILAIAWHWGMTFTFFLVMGFYLRYYFLSWSEDGTVYNFLSAGSLGSAAGSGSINQSFKANDAEVRYKWEWEFPEVKEIREHERFGEEVFGETPRRFVPMGTASFLFVLVGAYRTGRNTFGVAGLGNKHLYRVSKPAFECSWVPSPSTPSTSNTSSEAIQSSREAVRDDVIINATAATYTDDDVSYEDGMEYITVVVYCTFDAPVGIDGEGGQLKMIAKHDEAYVYTGLRGVEFVAMVEQPGVYTESAFDAPFQYDYLYCGPPLQGKISPHRAREWIAYHMRLFGESSHFIFYDAGGMDDVLWRVWEPWVKLRRVSVMNVRMQARYKGFYANQFVLANDCLLRAKTLAKWTFFFDIDEYLHLSHGDLLESSFHELMAEMAERGRRATTIELQQRPMLPDHCVRNDADSTLHERQWAIEKLVYRRKVNTSAAVWSHWQDIKAIHQAKYVLGRGIHWARHVEVPPGMEEWETMTKMNIQGCKNCYENKLHYYHFHGTTKRAPNEEVCKVFIDPNVTHFETDGATHEFDNTMSFLADTVREFEHHMIGEVTI
ncbi:unnamed protein product [Calypogeia fissa]